MPELLAHVQPVRSLNPPQQQETPRTARPLRRRLHHRVGAARRPTKAPLVTREITCHGCAATATTDRLDIAMKFGDIIVYTCPVCGTQLDPIAHINTQMNP